MTISSLTSKVQYTATGGTGFDYTFKILEADQLNVVTMDLATSAETTLTYPTDYTVTGAGVSTGGRVICTTAPTTGHRVTIVRDVELLQELDLVNNDPFDADSLEDALDKAWMTFQQMQEQLDRCVKAQVGSTADPADLIDDLIRYRADALASKNSAVAAQTAAEAAQASALAAQASAEAAFASASAAASSAWSGATSAWAAIAAIPTATTSVAGKVELATSAEALAGTSSALAVTPVGLTAALAAIERGAPSLYIGGLTVKYSNTSAVVVTSGVCRDDTDTVDITLSTSGAANITTAGINGLDTGSEAASTFYAVWVTSKADGTTGRLLSTSYTAPSLPSGYIYKRLIGTVYNNSSSSFVQLSVGQAGQDGRFRGTQLWMQNVQSDGTGGGTGVTNTPITYGFNTQVPQIPGCYLGSSGITTLTPGEYEVTGFLTLYRVDFVLVDLYNNTDASVIARLSTWVPVDAAAAPTANCGFRTSFSLSATKNVKFRFNASSGTFSTSTQGVPHPNAAAAGTENYGLAVFRRLS